MKHKFFSIATILLFVLGMMYALQGVSGARVQADNLSIQRETELDWTQIITDHFPSPRSLHVTAYDNLREVTVLFGGWGIDGRLNDTWEWNGSEWFQRFPKNSPPSLAGAAMVYDSARRVCVLFGGYSGGYTNGTWEWDGDNWTQRNPVTSPNKRGYHAMVFDSQRMVTVLFGGQPESLSSILDDTWEWDGENWKRLFPGESPEGRAYHGMAYDNIRGETVLFGGRNQSFVSYYDTWVWNGTDWIRRSPESSPPTYASMVFDSAREVAVLFESPLYKKIAWEWDGVDWSQRTINNSPKDARYDYTLSYDSAREMIVLFGGYRTTSQYEYWYGETWEYGIVSDPDPKPTPEPSPEPTPEPDPDEFNLFLPLIFH